MTKPVSRFNQVAARKRNVADKRTDKRIEAAYYRTSSGVQIPMMAIPGIFRAIREEMTPTTTDEQLDVLVQAIVGMIRVN